MKIYETKVEAGTKQWLKIPVDEECSLKAAAFCGSRPGKRLIVTAGVHGCEYIGILAVSRLIQELDPRQMKGEVVFLPIANEGNQAAGTGGWCQFKSGISGNGNGKPVSEDSSSCGNVSVSRCGLPRGSP